MPLTIASKKKYHVNLAELMALTEANYLRICKVMPQMHNEDECDLALQLNGNEVSLTMRVVQRGPYTTTLDCQLDGLWQHQVLSQPQLMVQVYHDAKMAEVVASDNQRHIHSNYDYPNPQMRGSDEKLQLNQLLSDWLGHSLQYARGKQTVFAGAKGA